MDEAFEIQLKRNVESLVAEGLLGQAFNECTKIINSYPGNTVFVELKKVIEKKLLEENAEQVKTGIKEAEKLFDGGDTLHALKKVRELLALAPNHSKLIRMYSKYQEKYKKETTKAEQGFISKKQDEFKNLLESKSYPTILQQLSILQPQYNGSRAMQDLIAKTKESIIENELKDKEELLDSTKFEEIFSFINDLKNIDKSSPKLKRLEEVMKRKQAGDVIGNIKEFIYTGENDLDTLVKLGKYEEAVLVATEILKVNPSDEKVRKIFKKAKTKAFNLNRNQAVEHIRKALPQLKEDYKQNKENFIRL